MPAQPHAKFFKALRTRDYTEAIGILTRLNMRAAIEGTDITTVEDARAALRRLGTTIGS